MRALQADRIAARQRARDSAARARRTAEEREAQLQTRRDAYARRTAGEREAELQMRRDADAYVFFAMATAVVSLAKIISLRLAPPNAYAFH